MLSVPGAKTVRGYSFLETHLFTCCLRMAPIVLGAIRVLEYLNQVQSRLPPRPGHLGPDATGVGWISVFAGGSHRDGRRVLELARPAGLVSQMS